MAVSEFDFLGRVDGVEGGGGVACVVVQRWRTPGGDVPATPSTRTEI